MRADLKAAEGIGLVHGGGGNGLMGRLARSTLAAGGYVTGIIPSFLIRKEHALTTAQEMVVVEDTHERKQTMFDRADAFVAGRDRHARGTGRNDDLGAAQSPRQAHPHRRYRRLLASAAAPLRAYE
jgi:hypothetical protein